MIRTIVSSREAAVFGEQMIEHRVAQERTDHRRVAVIDEDEQHNPWTTLESRQLYDNPWIQVSERQVINPRGGRGIYGVVHFKSRAIGIVPVDDSGHTYLVGQFRYSLGSYSWEIPMGGCPLDEPPLRAAQRELQEETGLRAARWRHLLTLHTSNSVTDEVGELFLAEGLIEGEAEPEETELLKVWRLPLQEAIGMALDGRITDALSVAALLRLAVEPGLPAMSSAQK